MAGIRISRRSNVGGIAGGALIMPRWGCGQERSPAASPAACVPLEDGEGCLAVAPEAERVDLAAPVFTNPTQIDNPLFPISALEQVIQLGEEAGEPLRVEVTLLPDGKEIKWEGATVRCLRSHFVAYGGTELVEVATDFYAQADDGAVWYFGEDVFNYEDGEVANTDGTWLAGVDGPPGMIMPTAPAEGDVYRPENIPGVVFEEVTVVETGVSVDGPSGPVPGAIRTSELLMDGTTEAQAFAPGYGEFGAEAEDESVLVALAVPIDAGAEASDDLAVLQTALGDLTGAIGGEDWSAAADASAAVTTAWSTVGQADTVPPVLDETFAAALAEIGEAVTGSDAEAALTATLRASEVGRDLQLRGSPVLATDLGRMDDRARHLLARLTLTGADRLMGEVASMAATWERVGVRLDDADRAVVDEDLETLGTAVEAGDADGLASATAALREHLAAIG
jgi:hypothetical protein